ncbi:hypothetical protein VN0682_02070 [Helicobacter pylori]|nr:hypothetical protein VN0682_02070 [Helicobacter pylori]
MKTNEAQFYEVLENLFIGVKIEDKQESLLDPNAKAMKNGMLNLMKAKSKYYQSKKQELEKFIDLKCQNNNDLKEELFDKLYSFFKRYLSANGGIYFNDTPLYDSLYTKSDYEKCSLKKDTALFYKTKDLYYVKSETNYKDFCFELENMVFNFDTSSLESKKNNEKIDLVFNLKDTDTKTNTLNFSVTLSSKGNQTKISEILKEWIVLVDECHRTQSGKLHNAMKSLLPNAIFIAFSGTPLLKQDKKTSYEVFGDYIHCYKFNEAVSDKVVLDLNYEARSVDQYVSSPKKLDEYFELKTQNLNDTAKTELKKKWANLQKVFSTKNRLEHIVQDIVLDMAKLPRLSNGKGNAMLVAESVYNACRYFELFLETELKDKVAVITSYEPNITDLKDCGSHESEESYKYRTYCKMLQNFFNEKDEKKALNKTKEFEEEVKKRFINEPSRMKLLIVVDKLLTGFDAPSLTYLYIDKKMQDHGLFQAVCRVNRLDGEDKDFGCIIDYSDLFDSLQEVHSDYTNGAFENYEREDIQGLISDKAQKIKKKLEEARDQLRSLCESVKEPKDETDYIAYFCGSDLEKNAQKRRLFYQLVGAFLRMFVELNHLEKPIYSKEEMQKIKQEAQFYRHLQKMIGLNSGDSVDLKSYSEDMRRILDAYIKATDSKTLIKIEDQGLCEVLAQMDINDFNKELSEVFKNKSSMAESIANNTKKRIIEKEASDPKYYEKLSSLLNDLINQFREKKLTYLEYLQQIHNLAKQVIHKEDKNYPKKINTNALKTLYDNLDQNEALALEIDACIRDNKKDGWVGHNQKEKNLKIALRKTINDEGLLETIFNLAKHIDEYH